MKNTMPMLYCFIGVLCLALATLNIKVAMEQEEDRVAALEQQNEELKDNLGSVTDALYVYKTENASLTDALIKVDTKIKEMNTQTDAEEEDKKITSYIPEAERLKIAAIEEEKISIVIAPETVVASEQYETPVYEEVVEETESVDGCTYYGCMSLTAYIATGNPCADGEYPSVGYTVACNDPNLWHKWVYIEGVGDRYVHDTGGMASNVIDVFVGSYDEAIQFGRWNASVYVYN